MKVLQINTTYDLGSTGRIVTGIDNLLKKKGIESFVAYGYGTLEDNFHYKVINRLDSYVHNLCSRLTDGQGLFSTRRTLQLINWINSINPDIIHLHNLHGNYLNYKILFEYLSKIECKIVWTMHDCWPLTGHCAYFDLVKCCKWKSCCYSCPQKKCYPPSFFYDNSRRNFKLKKELFLSVSSRLVLVPVSNWLSDLIKESFFKEQPSQIIRNGINLHKFRPILERRIKPYVLGVAFPWDKRKGGDDFIKLRSVLTEEIDIILIGLSQNQIRMLPKGIIGVEKTESVEILAKYYSNALVFVNTTYEDNYPTVNLEAIACGTPVITYKTGGSPESVEPYCGLVVNQGDINGLMNAVMNIYTNHICFDKDSLRKFAEENFEEDKCFKKYLHIYSQL